MINYVIAVNNFDILSKNFGHMLPDESIILQRNFFNIPKAYNEAIKKCEKEYICFLHQDVFLPDVWWQRVLEQIKLLPEDWGVIGVAGVAIKKNEKLFLGNILDRGCEWGNADGLPVEVETLDELLLLVKNDNTLSFDQGVGNHFYGADLCMQSRLQGKKCYAIKAYCHHNSIHGSDVPPDFWESFQYMRKKYKDMLPIPTTCTIVQ